MKTHAHTKILQKKKKNTTYLFITAKNQKQCKCQLTDDLMKELRYVYVTN